MNISCETSVSLQKNTVCFCFQAVSVSNGTTELLHTEHIWYPRIREVKHEHHLHAASLCFFPASQEFVLPCAKPSFFFPTLDMFFSSVKLRCHHHKMKHAEMLYATIQCCFLPFISLPAPHRVPKDQIHNLQCNRPSGTRLPGRE